MKDEKKVPSIRFKGFTDAWEQRELENIVNRFDNLRVPVAESLRKKGNIPYYGANGIQGYVDGYTHNGEFILIAEDGANDLNNYPVRYVNGKIWVNNHAHVIQSKQEKSNNLFISFALSSADIKSLIVGGSRSKLTASSLMQIILIVPLIKEQQKIGIFLNTIESLLTLHQRKYDCLVKLKKSLLEKMFPKNGSDKPDIRFKGFTDAWEQRKLVDLAQRITRKNNNLITNLPLTISAEYGLVDQITYFNNRVASTNLKNYYLILNGEFAYNKSSSDGNPVGVIKRLDLYKNGALSILYIIFSIKDKSIINSDFLSVFFETSLWHKDIFERAAEGARNHGLLNISAQDFMEMNIQFPSQSQEQIKIKTLLNKLITLHQRKLEILQNLKKSLLEKMFV